MTGHAYPPERSPLRRTFTLPDSWAFGPKTCQVEGCHTLPGHRGYCQAHQPPEGTTMPDNDVQPNQTNTDPRPPHIEGNAADLPLIIDDPPPTDPGLRKAWQRRQQQHTPTHTEEDALPSAPTPHPLGRTVWYRSRTGQWTAPATITATANSLYQPNVDAGHVPPLTGPDHVHLTVLTPGIPGHISDSTTQTHPELADPDRPNRPAGGTFQEWDIGFWEPTEDERTDSDGRPTFAFDVQPAGTWMWPL